MDERGRESWATTSGRIRRVMLRTLLASIAVNAALGIWALLTDDFGQTEGKILATSVFVSVAMLSVLANGAPLQQRVLWPLPVVAALSAVGSLGLFTFLMWAEIDRESPVKLAFSGLVIAAGATLVGLLALLALRPRHEVIRTMNGFLMALLVATALYGIWFDVGRDWYPRLLGVESVLVAAFTLTIPVLWRFGERDQPSLPPTQAPGRPRDFGLASRVEQAMAAERRAFARSTAAIHPEAGFLDMAGGTAVYTGPELFSNRAFALGTARVVAEGDLDTIERFYAERGATSQIELPSVADPDLVRLLADRAYRLRRFRHILARPAVGPVPTTRQDLIIERVDESNADAWSRALIEGFGYEDPRTIARVEEWNAALLATPDLTALIARTRSEVVGSASVHFSGPTAVLGGAATRPHARRAGVQLALIVARIDLAQRAGCDLVVVTADPSTSSERNAVRAGFGLVCAHAVMERARADLT